MARVTALLRSHPVLAFVAVGLAGAGLLLVVLAAWPLPGLVRRAAEERLQARVTVPVRIERVNLNLFTGRARVSNIPRLALQLRGVAKPQEAESLEQERFKEALKKTPPVPDEPLVAVYRDAGGPAAKSPPPAKEMEQFVLDHMRIGPEDLTDLAAQRARVIQAALVRRGVEARRLYVGRAEDRAVQDGGPGRSSSSC